MSHRVLVACVGNLLRADDGIGPRVATMLDGRTLPEGTVVRDYGIGGIHLVQTLMEESFAGLVVVDCADQGRPPGTVMELQPEVLDVGELPHVERYDYLADMHYTDPRRALALARALGVLPPAFTVVGVQPLDAESLRRELSPAVEQAAEVAAGLVLEIVDRWRTGVT
ncbi:MAG: hydrogenase maturation protease [Acidimicrobiia bacterium]